MKNIQDWKYSSKKVWGASPAGTTFARDLKPCTKEFFEKVIGKRFTVEQDWLLKLVPFPKFKGRRVLEIGCGAGYDAYMFCLNKADYTGIDITPENIERAGRHLKFYNFENFSIAEGDAENLKFEDGSFDVVFSNGVLHHTPDIKASFKEACRVLKRGGEFYVILYNRNSIFHWLTLFLGCYIIKLGFLRRSFKDILSGIEYTTSNEKPLVNVYTVDEVEKLLEGCGFEAAETYVRKLVWQDFPLLKIFGFIWKRIPNGLMEWLGSRYGWYVIAKAVKK
ncbi:MAG TPA: class I SAM-dependent methyltransferase [Candidatus Wallbacteria bacterium]|nr:class I SAM-dependent methyltransferase [Candidatus Wallbacteria bacterium]